MVGIMADSSQHNFFRPLLVDFINPNHGLVLLADKIDWKAIEDEFSGLYSQTGQRGVPIRFMAACLMLKQLKNLGDETLAKAWVEDPYMQYFCGMAHFEHTFPHDPTVFVRFRQRIGEGGVEFLFAQSLAIQSDRAITKEAVSDTTVQEHFVRFPTDARMCSRGAKLLVQAAAQEGVELRQSYTKTIKNLLRATHNAHHPRRRKLARRSAKKLHTILGRLHREVQRKFTQEQLVRHQQIIELTGRVLAQERHSKDKVYSYHKPFTSCIAKGKAHKPYEFGSKVGLMMHPKNLLILAIDAFQGNPHDTKTLEPLIEQHKRLVPNTKLEFVAYDRAVRSPMQIHGVTVSGPTKRRKKDSEHFVKKQRARFRRRAAIEPVIGHLKTDFRMAQNYLWSKSGTRINAMLAAMAWNMTKWMEFASNQTRRSFLRLIKTLQYLQNSLSFWTHNNTHEHHSLLHLKNWA